MNKYILCCGSSTTELVFQVNRMIEIGYEPYGSVAACDQYFIQPMLLKQIKEGTDENNATL